MQRCRSKRRLPLMMMREDQADDADEKQPTDVDEVKQEEVRRRKMIDTWFHGRMLDMELGEASEKDGAPAGEVSGASLDLNLGIKARDGDRGSEAGVEDEGSEQAES
ncbi:uncharacterized protein A4U43_C05F10040 [Asparagus officinalis]|uniref:Uncharacterized protein n=1 Tax=Asparagus officinalis TaxID=4686 RepID=A0A5P1EQL8_ASPOF|nr:uncharacterized protein A4U43_C05F10040 [Asparagus officinalis]